MLRTEIAVIGGSYAGLSAALQLARARRHVLVVDAGQRRNRFVDDAGGAAHGFLSRDGTAPGAIAAEARQQLQRYATVQWLQGLAKDPRGLEGGGFCFRVGAQRLQADRLVLATGVTDTLPPVPGLAERWGRSVFHCPYCHGYEMQAGPIGIIAASAQALHHALMLPDWGQPVLLLNGAFSPGPDDLAALARRGTQVEPTPIGHLEGVADVVLVDGRRLHFNGLFTQPETALASPLAQQLGCALAEGPMGPYIRVDAMQQTSVPRVFACGDAARAAGNVALAVADGAVAGMAAHRSVMFPA